MDDSSSCEWMGVMPETSTRPLAVRTLRNRGREGRRGFVAMTSESDAESRSLWETAGRTAAHLRPQGGRSSSPPWVSRSRVAFQFPASAAPRTARDPPPTYLPVVTFSPRLKSRYEATRRWLSPPDRVYRSRGSFESLLESTCASLTTITTSLRDDLVNGEHPPMHVQAPPTDK